MTPFYRKFRDMREFNRFAKDAQGDFCFLVCWDQTSNVADRFLYRKLVDHVSLANYKQPVTERKPDHESTTP